MAVREIVIARWRLSCAFDATIEAYRGMGAWQCDCTPCLNFTRLGGTMCAPALRETFLQLGIDHAKPAEMYHSHRLESGRHHYSGWFHVVGSILEGADCWAQTDLKGRSFVQSLERIEEHVSIGFSSRIALPAKSFSGHQLIQLHVGLELPWALDAEEPA